MRGRVRSCEAWVGGCGRRRSIAVVGRLVVWVVRRWGGGCARRRLLWRRLLIAHGRGRRCARLRRVPGWRAVGRRRVGIVGVGSERRSIRVPRRWRAVAGRRCAIGRWWRRRVARGRRAVCRRWRIRRAICHHNVPTPIDRLHCAMVRFATAVVATDAGGKRRGLNQSGGVRGGSAAALAPRGGRSSTRAAISAIIPRTT
mmetsp:Transcript_16681/g.45238  ORF Transcript_16681/g.45238 Transcript_16681/m.45238 type:complete len:200 (-) Transcript_16681:532-1131(-)